MKSILISRTAIEYGQRYGFPKVTIATPDQIDYAEKVTRWTNRARKNARN